MLPAQRAPGLTSMVEDVVHFMVVPNSGGGWSVIESGFAKPLAEFAEADVAEKYALRLAESKLAWKVDIFDASGSLTATYNSEDDAMPKPDLSEGTDEAEGKRPTVESDSAHFNQDDGPA